MWVSAAELWADQTCDRVTSHSANLQLHVLLAGFTCDWGGSVVRGGGHGHGVLLEGGEVGRSYIRRFVFRDRNDGASLTWARLLCLEIRFKCVSAAPHLKLRRVWKRQKSRLLQFDPSSSDLLSSVFRSYCCSAPEQPAEGAVALPAVMFLVFLIFWNTKLCFSSSAIFLWVSAVSSFMSFTLLVWNPTHTGTQTHSRLC